MCARVFLFMRDLRKRAIMGRDKETAEVLLTGTFLSNARGFGFVRVEGREEDLFIPAGKVNGAFHQDVVQVALLPGKRGNREEAKVVSVITRGIAQIVGTFEQNKEHYGFVVPDLAVFPGDIFVPAECSKGAVSGHKVVVEITDYGDERRNPEGRVTEILGHVNDPGVDILSIVKGYKIPMEFSEKQLRQAENVAKPVSDADRAGRRDLRGLTMVTIDGEDAKDLDDAVSLSFDGECYHLGVHIADVANYVQENSALDREALERGTSVYLVDRVIPMLPHLLSNGICSLNAGEDRLALSCLMRVDLQGEICDYEICESVIRVSKRMTYTAVHRILQDRTIADRDPEYAQYAPFAPMFAQMAELSALLRKKRNARGAIDFNFPECKIILDREGHPLEINAYERNTATDIIEDFMLAANETVAQHFYWMEIPFLYRTHDVPDRHEFQKLTAYLKGLGISLKSARAKGGKGGSRPDAGIRPEVHPKEVQKLLAKVAGTPEEPMVSRLALRSMKQAVYNIKCTGHFGLACPYYCHFTSPIRRYPDLQIHRIIKEQLRGRMNGDKIQHYQDILPKVATHSSDMERRADEAERETDKLKKAEYMEDHLGEIFEGVISGTTKWGIYVMLPNTVEGMIPIAKMPGDRYFFNEQTNEVIGSEFGKSFRLGMSVKVQAAGCDRQARTIDFALEEDGERAGTQAFSQAKTSAKPRAKKPSRGEKTGKTKKARKSGKLAKKLFESILRKGGRAIRENERKESKWRGTRKRKD